MDRIICVVGPTASGKTALAVELAKYTDGEVVSCDSMQIYRRLSIGTANGNQPENLYDILDGKPVGTLFGEVNL